MAGPAVCEVPRQAGLGTVHADSVQLLQRRLAVPVPRGAREGVPGDHLQEYGEEWPGRRAGEAEGARPLDEGRLGVYTQPTSSVGTE